MTSDPYDLARFIAAQAGVFDTAMAELRAGRKRSHWMWFVFPQMLGLGRSPMAQRYGMRSLAGARAYIAHPVLGVRLEQAARAVLQSPAVSLQALFGSPDELKFCSSMTLFDAAAPGLVFGQALERWCDGRRDPRTWELLEG